MKKIKFILPFVALALFSCDDFLDINDSPNNPDGSKVTPNLILPAAETGPYRVLARTGNVFGNLFLNNWGFNVNSFAVTNSEEFTLAINNNTYAGIWDGLYTSTANLTNIINHPAPNYENHKAMAKVLKSFYFQYLVDLYGDIPYTEAHLGSANLTPSYDDDKAIYRDLVVQLEDAIATFDSPLPSANVVGAEDVIFQGDLVKWKKFANTLKLRILMRQSEMTDGETATYLATEFAELASVDFVDANATINPGYSNNAEQQNPYYDLFYTVGAAPQAETTIFRQYRASKYFGDLLNTNPVDPRRGVIFGLVSGSVQGVIQGDSAIQSGGTAPLNISPLGTGFINSPGQDGYMMTLAESKFLQAEAVHRGYLTGDAQTLFDEGIAASFNQLGVGAGAAAYIADVNAVDGKGYAAGSNSQQKINAIMYQKNVAMNGINAMEVFIEYTRTGYIDTVPLALGAQQTNRPRRLLYPNSEIVGNTANVPAQTVNDVFVSGAFWWVP